MTTLTVYDAPPAAVAPAVGFWNRARRAGAVYVMLGLVAAVLFGALASAHGTARFTFGQTRGGAGISIGGRPGAIGFGLLATLAGVVLLVRPGRRLFGWMSGVALASVVVSFLCWQVGGQVMPLGNQAQNTVNAALPLVFGALAGVLGERSGVINIAIEAQLLMGAFAGALFGTIVASAWIGVVAAAIGGMLIGLLLAVLAIRYLVDQVVLGVVLNLLVLGVTSFLYSVLMVPNAARYNTPPAVPTWKIPGLSNIPVIGPALFGNNVFVYLAIILVIAVHVGLFHTRWGLRTRAVGEHPTAADTVGIKVLRTRYRNLAVAGLIAGVGGATLTLAPPALTFTDNMAGGRGFIALAALIFGRWSPVGATLAALLFGFAQALATFLSVNGSSIPAPFLQMLPYVATIIAVAGLVGRVRAPAADGKPYVKG
jgi:general nucleoside transport system permease protein